MKKLLLPLALLFATAQIYAQLYVSPNGSSDSYVYVDDQVLFVEEDVNLVENNAGTTQASIYLRNDAQLIQGATSSANSGTGYISVYQDSNADAYDYNYWCSPVGAMTSTGNQFFGLARFYDRVDDTDSNLAGTTFSNNGSSSPLVISSRWIYRWNVVGQEWRYTGTSALVPAGRGFTMKGTDVTVHSDPFNEPQNQLYDFRGRPNNGEISLPMETTGVTWDDGNAYYFTMTGNPYPSALDLNLVFNDPDNVEIESFCYWDEDRSVNSHFYVDNKGSYSTWVPGVDPYNTGGVYTMSAFMNYDSAGHPISATATDAPYTQRLYAPIGQGFMIRAIPGGNGGDGTVYIRNSHRAYIKEGAGNNSVFRSNTGAGTSPGDPVPNPNTTPQLRIHTVFGEGTHFRDMVLLFHDSATDGFDRGLDASSPQDLAGADAYFTIRGNEDEGARDLVIQTVPYDNPRKKIPITFALETQNSLVVKVVEDVNTPFNKAYLYDSDNNSYQEITNDNEASLLLDAGTYRGRFYITFRGPVPNDDDETPNGFEDIMAETYDQIKGNVQVVQNNKQTQLEVNNPEKYDIAVLNMFDVAGRLVMTQENVGSEMRYSFPTSTLSDGVYLVRVTTHDNITVGYKVSVVNK